MKQDLLAKRYYSDNRRFADLINGIVCNGIPIVKQEDLSEMDTETGQGKRRDLVRKAVFGVNFAVLGLENQEKLDYRLPLRVLGYEVGAYEHQAAEIYREIRRNGRNSDTELSSGEYLYGFRKSDRLHPVITIILYYGEEEWNGSRDLYGILDFQDIPGIMILPKKNWKDLELGYAITCHKAQGSQCKKVIVGLDFGSFIQLSREWVYTAMTRAIDKCYMVAQNNALS